MQSLTVAVSLSQDGQTMGAVAVEARPVPPLRVMRVERVAPGPGFKDATEWLRSRGGHPQIFGFGAPGARENRSLLVDCGHVLLGRPFAEAMWRSDARRLWQIRMAAVEITGVDLAIPQREAWRVKVSRREVVASLLAELKAGLVFEDRAHAKELRGQLETFTERRERDDPEGAGGELAIALALAAWEAGRVQRRLEDALPRRHT